MPIGPLVPGNPTTVTKDDKPTCVNQVQGPAVDGLIVADDVLESIQLCLNLGIELTTLTGMTSKTAADTGAMVLVILQGLYYYDSGVTAATNAPWIYQATGIGVGAWVAVGAGNLLANMLTDTKVNQQLIPNWQIVQSVTANSGASIAWTVENATYQQMHNTASAVLDVQITNLQAGDKVKITAGPFEALVAPSDILYMEVVVAQGSTTAYYEQSINSADVTLSTTGVFWWHFVYQSSGTANATIGFNCKNSGSVASAIYLGTTPIGNWGVAGNGYQYCSYEVQRKF